MTKPQVLNRLRAAIREQGGQTYLADKIGITPCYISNALAGRCDPGPKLLRALGLEKIVSYREMSKP